ncbi:MAG TPA: acyl-CoA dehydrogenase family protein [Thermoplasmata archaeon]|nr:acyl-CoA dehydrogenase family protein [Thermoplasmata archaeon]
MEFALSSDEAAFQDALRKFGDRSLRPAERTIDREGRIPDTILAEMSRLGLLAMPVGTEFGGLGASAVLTELAAEEVGRGDSSMATAVFFLLEAGWGWVLDRFGTKAAREEVLPPVCAGKAFLGIATTEPTGGSDLANLQTTSRRDGDAFVVRGEKAFLSGVEEAKRLGGGHLTLTRGASAFNFVYVPTNSTGITTAKYENMGRMGISTGQIHYEDVRVPAHYLLGGEGEGFTIAMEGFNVARTFVSAACVGAAERALETGTAYIRERHAFGSPLAKFEAIQFELVDLYAQVEAVKWQCRRAAWLTDRYLGGDHSLRSDMIRAVSAVKLTAPPIAFECVKRVMMWFGAAGYTKDVGLEIGLRGVMSYLVGAEGGLNIMRIILGRELLGKEFVPYK